MSGMRLISRFRRSNRGAAAIEFALVAPMLFGIIFATLEAGWLMTQSIMLDRALDRTVRLLRIGSMPVPEGEAQVSYELVKQKVCEEALILANCDDTLALELIPIKSAADFPSDDARCVDRTGEIEPTLRYNPGGRSDTVFVRACFVVDPLTPLMEYGLKLPRDKSGGVRIVSYSAFANEPA